MTGEMEHVSGLYIYNVCWN